MFYRFRLPIGNCIFFVIRNLIQTGKFSVIFLGSNIVSFCRFDFGRISTEMYRVPIGLNVRFPKIAIFVPRNTLKAGGCIGVGPHILHVLGMCNQTEIATAIVNAVAIYMIDLHALWHFNQKAMHQDTALIFSAAHRCLGIAEARKVPFVCHKHDIVFVVYKGKLPTGERDLFGHGLLLMVAVETLMMVAAEGDEVVEVVAAAGAAGGDVVDADLFETVFGAAGVLAGEVVADVGAHSLFLPAVGAAFTATKGGDEDGEGVDDGAKFQGDGCDVEGFDRESFGHVAGEHMKSFLKRQNPALEGCSPASSPTAVP